MFCHMKLNFRATSVQQNYKSFCRTAKGVPYSLSLRQLILSVHIIQKLAYNYERIYVIVIKC